MSGNGLRLLVVDDDPAVRAQLRGVLEDEGHAVDEAGDGEQALRRLAESAPDVVLLDLRMPNLGGLDALPRILEAAPDTAVVVVSGETSLDNAFRAGQLGAYDFVSKPVDPPRLLETIAEAARVSRLRRQGAAAGAGGGGGGARVGTAGGGPGAELGIIGASAAIATLLENVRRVAPSQGRVLVTGENGSGKELVAQAIPRLSKRAAGPFVKLNCAAIPKDLVESELFGYEKGAFTGALQAKRGRLEVADGGTLFLDEIGDLSLEAQAKLLRAIETGEVERVGGTKTLHCDARIVAATNKDLAQAIEDGEFRQDLFFRLNVLPLNVPPLRERAGDIELLARHFLARFCGAEELPPKDLSPEALAALEAYAWPGNVRELRNLMERAAILVEGEQVRDVDVEPWLVAEGGDPDAVGLRGEIGRREADAIRKALESAGWNVTQAAAGLGIDRTNLHRKMRKYGIKRR